LLKNCLGDMYASMRCLPGICFNFLHLSPSRTTASLQTRSRQRRQPQPAPFGSKSDQSPFLRSFSNAVLCDPPVSATQHIIAIYRIARALCPPLCPLHSGTSAWPEFLTPSLRLISKTDDSLDETVTPPRDYLAPRTGWYVSRMGTHPWDAWALYSSSWLSSVLIRESSARSVCSLAGPLGSSMVC
jgi:hypothetical protein